MKLPKSWNEVTIKSYLKIHDALNDKELGIIERQVQVLASLTEHSIEDIELIDIDLFKSMVRDTAFLYENDIPKEIPIVIEIDNVKYLFDPIKPIKKAGEFIDLSHLTKEPENIIYNIHKILALLCKPMKEQDYEERCQIFLNKMTIDKAYPIAVFFCNVFQRSLPIIQSYLEKDIKKNLKVMKKMLK